MHIFAASGYNSIIFFILGFSGIENIVHCPQGVPKVSRGTKMGYSITSCVFVDHWEVDTNKAKRPTYWVYESTLEGR